MSEVLTFEVRVLVDKGQEEYKPINHYGKGERIRENILKMVHIEARTHKQAINKAQRYGRVLSCRKANVDRIMGDMSLLPIRNEDFVPQNINPYQTAIAMDEMIWLKRNKRRDNLRRDKIGY